MANLPISAPGASEPIRSTLEKLFAAHAPLPSSAAASEVCSRFLSEKDRVVLEAITVLAESAPRPTLSPAAAEDVRHLLDVSLRNLIPFARSGNGLLFALEPLDAVRRLADAEAEPLSRTQLATAYRAWTRGDAAPADLLGCAECLVRASLLEVAATLCTVVEALCTDKPADTEVLEELILRTDRFCRLVSETERLTRRKFITAA